ncbi:MAG: Uncharacterised protein [SAR116 cluster bacterium]|nr:MAG: Uncharacterised protein [SAR116 cluster bacterium]
MIGLLRDPYVGSVRTVIHNGEINQRVRMRANAAIAHHDRATAMADGDGDDFVFHRTRICIDIDHGHVPIPIRYPRSVLSLPDFPARSRDNPQTGHLPETPRYQ